LEGSDLPRVISNSIEKFTASAEFVVGGTLKDYGLLLKPRVMTLVVFSGVVGLMMAPGGVPGWTALLAVACIAAGAGGAGALNMWYDRDIDRLMTRTMNRPLPAGRMGPAKALWLGLALSVIAVMVMALAVNELAALLLAVTIAYYVIIYTMWLKRRTPQNIVIGGAAGAFPPMIGWAAVSGDIGAGSLVLFAIIFLWTPPHFWSLALYRRGDYARAGVPMLPVVAGVRATKKQILVYSLLLVPVTMLPVTIGMSGPFYGASAGLLGAWLLVHAARVWRDHEGAAAKSMFLYSIVYLSLILAALLADRILFH
jgi:heme o synthase